MSASSSIRPVGLRDSERKISLAVAKKPKRWSQRAIRAALELAPDNLTQEQHEELLDAFDAEITRVMSKIM